MDTGEVFKFGTGLVAILLAGWNWSTAGLIAGFFLSLIMSVWYIYNLVCKFKDRNKKEKL